MRLDICQKIKSQASVKDTERKISALPTSKGHPASGGIQVVAIPAESNEGCNLKVRSGCMS